VHVDWPDTNGLSILSESLEMSEKKNFTFRFHEGNDGEVILDLNAHKTESKEVRNNMNLLTGSIMKLL
jgi:hypothetical protein